jgi:predicted ABC-type ATPase
VSVPLASIQGLLQYWGYGSKREPQGDSTTLTPNPSIIVLAGPNGAGKSTAAPWLLQDLLGVGEFVNADVIARGLSAFEPERAAIAAGRIMLARLKELGDRKVSFAFETTLASRSFAPRIASLQQSGYEFHLLFLWLPDADTAVARVADRVRSGGHNVPEEIIRRHYNAGLFNFFKLYRPMTTTWQVFDNSGLMEPSRIAAGRGALTESIKTAQLWERLEEKYLS